MFLTPYLDVPLHFFSSLITLSFKYLNPYTLGLIAKKSVIIIPFNSSLTLPITFLLTLCSISLFKVLSYLLVSNHSCTIVFISSKISSVLIAIMKLSVSICNNLILSLYIDFITSYQNSYINSLLLSRMACPTAIGLFLSTDVFLISIASKFSEKIMLVKKFGSDVSFFLFFFQ